VQEKKCEVSSSGASLLAAGWINLAVWRGKLFEEKGR